MTLFKQVFGDLLKTSPAFKHVVAHVMTLASEAIRISKSIVDLQHNVKELAEHIQAHQIAIQHMYAVQNATVNSMKKQSLDVSMPLPKSDETNKPN